MYNSGNNPSLVKTELDFVVKEEFDREMEPGEIVATNPLFFTQDSTDRGSVIFEEMSGPGLFDETEEEEEIPLATIATGNQKTVKVKNYKKSIKIPIEFFEDDASIHGTTGRTFTAVGNRARTSRDHYAFSNSYGDAFSGVTTPDGKALCANDHSTINGDTVDNLETGTLTPANMEVIARRLRLQKAQDGELGGHVPAGLLVSASLHPDALEITKSTLKADTANNNLNYFSEIYPGLVVGTSAFLDSTYNSLNTNVDTSYFLVSRNHTVTRWVRVPFTTRWVDPDNDDRDRYTYKCRFREIVAPQGWEGIVGSNGTV